MGVGLLAIGLTMASVQPVRGAVTCASWTQGTLVEDGTWRAGTASTDTDARTVCTSTADAATLTFVDLEAASNYPDPATTRRLVIDVSDPHIAYVNLRLDDNEDGEMVITGGLFKSEKDGIRYILSDLEPGQEDENLKFVSFATISGEGTGTKGIYATSEDIRHRGRLEWENSGKITVGGARGHGLFVRSDSQADGSQAANAVPEARAVNSGSITVSGDADNGERTFGVIAYSGGGSALATAINTGRIVAEGEGSFGLLASAPLNSETGTSGDSVSENRGNITVTGDVTVYDSDGDGSDDRWRTSAGQVSWSEAGFATVVNEGFIRTEGTVSYGAAAYSVSGWASITNRGRVVTTGGSSDSLPGSSTQGSRALYAESTTGSAMVLNDREGVVETSGDRAFGMLAQIEADNAGPPATVEVGNRGTVVTTGQNADAVLGLGLQRGLNENMNRIEVYNEEGASISTTGDGSGGMSGIIILNAGGPPRTEHARGSIEVRNDGVIRTSGGHGPGGPELESAFGIAGGFVSTDGTSITNAGDVTLHNSGSIIVTGAHARGIQATTYGDGKATVMIDGGSVTASYDSETDDLQDGVGIFARSLEGGVEATIRNGASVTAPQALRVGGPTKVNLLNDSTLTGRVTFSDAADVFTISDSVVHGNIDMDSGDDQLILEGGGLVNGDIDFGSGQDRLDLNIAESTDTSPGAVVSGAITSLESLYKRGPGGALVRDVSFSGSSAVIEEGTLIVQGHFDLGQNGTMTVDDSGRLSVVATAGGNGALLLPKITAGGGVTAKDDQGADTDVTVWLQNGGDASATAEQMTAGLWGSGTTLGGTSIQYRTEGGSGGETDLGTGAINSDGTPGQTTVSGTPGQIQLTTPVTPTPPAGSGGGSGGGGGGAAGLLVGGGVLALLLSFLDFGPTDTQPALYGRPRPGFVQASVGESQFWSRNLSQSTAIPASGAELGMDVAVGDGFALGVVLAPEFTARQSHEFGALSLSGGRYGLRTSWRDDAMFAGFGVTRADWRADTAFDNRALGGALQGQFEATQTDLRLGAGVDVALGRGLTLTPSAEFFAGELRQDGYRADGLVFHAAIPGVMQRYHGWKAGLALASGWRDGPQNLKLRPSLKLTAMRAQTSSDSFTVKQSDRLGVVTTSSQAHLADAPQTVLAIGAGLEAADDDGFSFRLGYVGVVADGKPQHALVGGLKLRF